jgi:hypothetical protein
MKYFGSTLPFPQLPLISSRALTEQLAVPSVLSSPLRLRRACAIGADHLISSCSDSSHVFPVNPDQLQVPVAILFGKVHVGLGYRFRVLESEVRDRKLSLATDRLKSERVADPYEMIRCSRR